MIINKKEACCKFEDAQPHTIKEHVLRYEFACNYVRNKQVIDVACGVGYGSDILAASGAKFVTGYDILEENITQARHRYTRDNLAFLKSDITQCNLQPESCDVAVSFETIEHIEKYPAAIKNIYNSLRLGGEIIISTPNRTITNPYLSFTDRPDFKYHFREYTRGEIILMLEMCGFHSIQEFGQQFQFFFHSPLLEKYYKRLFKPHKKISPDVVPFKNKNRLPTFMVFVAKK